jgi:predicted dehydrogenase
MTPLRVVLIGAGPMGRLWAAAIAEHPEATLVGWVDLAKERVTQGIDALGLGDVAVEADLDAALESLRPDFVVDAATPDSHHEITRRCLDRGIAVLGEKPMAATLEEGRDLVERSERSSTLFVVSQNRRYTPGLVAFRDLIAGRLEGIAQLNAEFYRAAHFGGFREQMDSPLLLDMAIHTFDAARYLIGSDPRSVYCVEFNPHWSWFRGAASALAVFDFVGGARFTYQGSWCAAGWETSWESSWRATGRLGSAVWDGYGSPVAEIGDGDGVVERVEAVPAVLAREGIAGSLADFVKGIREGRAPMNECHDNIKSLAMVMAALESSRSSCQVAVEW